MTHYRRGAEFERRIMFTLHGHGYDVFRSAGSHGVADVVAFKPGEIVFVQCKLSGNISIAEWNEFYAVAQRVGAVAVIALKPSRGQIAFRRLTGTRVARQPPPHVPWMPDVLADAPITTDG